MSIDGLVGDCSERMVSYNLFAHTPLVVFPSESATVTDSIRRRSQKRARELSERGKSYASLEIDFGARVVQRPQLPRRAWTMAGGQVRPGESVVTTSRDTDRVSDKLEIDERGCLDPSHAGTVKTQQHGGPTTSQCMPLEPSSTPCISASTSSGLHHFL